MNYRLIFFCFLILTAKFNNGHGQSLSKTDSLLDKLKVSEKPYDKVLLLNSVAAQLSSTKVDSAIQLCKEGLRLSEKTNNDSLTATCYKCLINAYYQKAYFEDSALYFGKLFEQLASRIADLHKLNYEVYVTIGDVYLKKHNYPEATKYYQTAFKEAEKTGNSETLGYAMSKMIDMYRKADNCHDAKKIALSAIELGRKEKLTWLVFNGYRGLGICFDINAQYDSAITYFSKALEVSNESNQKSRIAVANGLLGVAYWHNKEYSNALRVLKRGREFHIANGNNDGLITNSQNLCCVYRDSGLVDSALYYGHFGLDLAVKKNQYYTMTIIRGILSSIYEKKGDYKTAFELTRLVQQFNDSVNTVERSRVTRELEEKYKNTEKQAKIELLNKEAELNLVLLEEGETKILNATLLNRQQQNDLLIQ